MTTRIQGPWFTCKHEYNKKNEIFRRTDEQMILLQAVRDFLNVGYRGRKGTIKTAESAYPQYQNTLMADNGCP